MRCVETLLALKGREVGAVRMKKYRSMCNTLARLAHEKLCPTLKDMKKTEELAARIRRAYKPETRSSLFLALKMLWKLTNGYDLQDSPKEIRWLKANVSRSELPAIKTIPEEVYRKILETATPRNRAIFSLLYEAGPRNSEMCLMRKSDVEFIKDGARVHIPSGTKTGPRSILVIDCVPALANWIANHPMKRDDAPLFVGYYGKRLVPLSAVALEKMAKDAGKQAKAGMRIYPHLFRHTAATRLAAFLTESQMCAYFGWAHGSAMPSRYVHLSGRDVDPGILKMHKRPVEEKQDERKTEPVACSRCGKTNMHDARMCAYCGMPFDKDKAKRQDMELLEQMKAGKKREKEMLDRITAIELQLAGKRTAPDRRKA